MAARLAPRPDAGADGSTPGDLTRQHGGGGRLGPRVGAAAATATATATVGSCAEHPLPRFHLCGGTGLGQTHSSVSEVCLPHHLNTGLHELLHCCKLAAQAKLEELEGRFVLRVWFVYDWNGRDKLEA
ncbi:hypothetical protein J1605_004319 [Eschrichtius robustus]|uniref:Uncharacterized protein n=1 Tax=Eschrichtius robustus TaxID=9764 RepID=A0AB34HET6_ESCRO|nr:hypothetical protein J1605_004319 [Eschrichtius robustus]